MADQFSQVVKFCQRAGGQGMREIILWTDNENISTQDAPGVAFLDDISVSWDFTSCHSQPQHHVHKTSATF